MYSQTMAARFDCKKLLRFAVATLCLLALALLMPVAANAADAIAGENETAEWKATAEEKMYATFNRKGSATKDVETTVGKATLAVHVLQKDGTFLNIPRGEDFLYQYNSGKDEDLADKLEEGYAGNPSIPHAFKELEEDEGGYGSVDLLVTAAEGYKIYQVDYTVCYSSKGPEKTGWRADKDDKTATSENVPTQFYYLDNITDGTTVDVYLMPAYTVKYQLMYGKNVVADPSEYSKYIDNDAGLFDSKVAYPKSKEEATANVDSCVILEDVSKAGLAEKGNLYGYHRWCDHENEPKAVNLAVSQFKKNYNVDSSVTVPTLNAKANYTVSGWKVNGNSINAGTVNMSELAQYADENRVITLTAVVEDKTPSTDNNGNGDNGGNNGGDNNNNGGDSGNNGGKESTPTPTPETTPTSTPSVTTVTAVAPTATPTATPAPTAEPTATPAPAAVSAHIPQTSDDMPYTLLVVTALASLCAAGAMFKKRRSK